MNKIENSKIILILSILLVLLVMGSVSASDDKIVNETISTPNNNNDNIGVDIQTTTESGSNDEQVLTADNTDNNIGSSNTTENNNLKSNNQEILTATTYTFTDLYNKVKNGGTVNLNGATYVYTSSRDSAYVGGITLPNNIVLNGGGATINANNQAAIFIVSGKATINNIKFINGNKDVDGVALNFQTGSNSQINDCTFNNF